jgi:hypothetical protein
MEPKRKITVFDWRVSTPSRGRDHIRKELRATTADNLAATRKNSIG